MNRKLRRAGRVGGDANVIAKLSCSSSVGIALAERGARSSPIELTLFAFHY